jgi:hypothetical protein
MFSIMCEIDGRDFKNNEETHYEIQIVDCDYSYFVGGTVILNSAAPMAQGDCVYLSTDIFYIEIKMDPSGMVIDAKIMYSDAMCQGLQASQVKFQLKQY